MIIVGLTGSIAMGKSETARMFARQGVPVFDSDAAVHALYASGGEAVPIMAGLAPGAVVDGAVDRKRLAAEVMTDPGLLKRIELAVHPLVQARQKRFLETAAAAGKDLAILDVPLLFETGREKTVDKIVVVSAGPELQRDRALQRPGMTPEKLDFILGKQMPDAEKRRRADFVIDTSKGLPDAESQVQKIVAILKALNRSKS